MHDWKNLMEEKYGNHIGWFDIMAGESKCLKVKSYIFKKQLKSILANTLH
jgi:hypothetical protein